MRVGIVVDDWKLPVFRRQLTEAGFAYEDGGAVKGETTLLTVITDDPGGIAAVVTRCQLECNQKGKPK